MLNEIKKLGYIKTVIAFVIVAVLLNLLQFHETNGYNANNWRQGAMEEKQIALEMLEKDNLSSEVIQSWNNVIKKIDYCLETDTPYDVENCVTHATNMGGMDTFLYLILVIVVSRVVSIEDKSKTWKNLFCTPTRSKSLILKKAGYTLLVVVSSVLIFLVFGLLFGTIKFGMPQSNIDVVIKGSSIVTDNIYVLFAKTYGVIALKALFWSSLVFCITSLVANSDKLSIAVSLFLVLASEMVGELLPEAIGKFAPFEDLSSAPTVLINEMSSVTILLSVYIIGLLVAAITFFKRKV